MDELKYLGRKVATGALNRHDFMGRASALGLTATAASSLMAGAAKAAGAQKGGTLRAGVQGVPAFVFAERYVLSGAQPKEVFLDVFDKLAAAAA